MYGICTVYWNIISGYETYVILDATRGISVETIDAALVAMKQTGMCHNTLLPVYYMSGSTCID